MRLILRESVEHLGSAGEVVTVRDGYGRNFLLPRGLALPATAKDEARLEAERRVIAARAAKLLKELQAQAERLNQISVNISRAVGEGDRLYGSVTKSDIAAAINEKGVPVDSRKIVLEEPIKALGLNEVKIKLSKDVSATIKVWVVKE